MQCLYRRIHVALQRALCLSLLGIAAASASGRVIYVNASSTNPTPDGLTWSSAFPSLPPALDAAADSDEVWIGRGVYTAPVEITMNVSLYGGFQGNESTRDQRRGGGTVLIGPDGGTAIRISVSGAVRLDGLVIRDGYRGIECASGLPLVTNCVVAGNVEGITVLGGQPTLLNNTLIGNACAVYLKAGDTVLRNNLIVFNDIGVQSEDAASLGASVANHLFGNSRASEGFATPWTQQADPKLAAPEYGRFHLLPGSPAIDAGVTDAGDVLTEDIDGEPRRQGEAVDIGADEFSGTAWSAEPAIVRVSPSGDDANDGSAWDKAKRTIPAAVDAAAVSGGEVWVAAGTYTEPVRVRAFTHLYGGFAGSETARTQRDFAANPTTITAGPHANAVRVQGGFTFTTLDGFTVRDSEAGVKVAFASPAIANNTFSGNRVAVDGLESSPRITGNAVHRNYEGLELIGGTPVVRTNRVSGQSERNVSIWQASPVVRNNAVTGAGDAGLYLADTIADVTNNTLAGNREALVVGDSQASVVNNIIAHNQAGVRLMRGDAPALSRNVVFDHFDTYVNMPAPPESAGNIAADPKIALAAFGGIHIQLDSPAMNAGDPAAVLPDDTDIDGQARVMNGQVDIGADESDGSPVTGTPKIVRVRPDGDDANDGATWATAKKTVQAAVDAAVPGGEVWVAEGTYTGQVRVYPLTWLYGGFAGTEEARDARDIAANTSVLSYDQPRQVVQLRGGYRFGRVDGFTVSGEIGGISLLQSAATVAHNHLEGIRAAGINDAQSRATIERNTIDVPTISGNGIYLDDSSSFVTGNTVRGSGRQAPPFYNGNGIALNGGSPLLTSNVISNMTFGIGLYLYAYSGDIRAINNTIHDTYTGISTGYRGSHVIANNIITHAVRGIHLDDPAIESVIRHNNVYLASTPYYGLSDKTGTNGNISADPLYVNAGAGDFRLRAGSPSIDTGDDAYVDPAWMDADGAPRVQGAHVNMGAYESSVSAGLMDAIVALRIWGGLQAATPYDIVRLRVASDKPTLNQVALGTASTIIRRLILGGTQ